MDPRFTSVIGLCAAAVWAGGCTDPEPPNRRRLEVLGVRAEPPSGIPGARIELELLHSGQVMPLVSNGEVSQTIDPSAVRVAWLGGCHNPPGGAYYGCFPGLRAVARQLPTPIPEQIDPTAVLEGVFGVGMRFAVQIPDDVLAETRGGLTGVSFAFFAACHGELWPKPEATDTVPLGCYDSEGNELGGADFAVGFTTLRTTPGVENTNPTVSGLRLDGVDLQRSSCQSDDDCSRLSRAHWPYRCGDDHECWPVLENCNEPTGCPRPTLEVVIDPSSAEALPSGEGSRPLETLHARTVSLLAVESGRREIYPGVGEVPEAAEFPVDSLPEGAFPDQPQIPLLAMVEDGRGGRGWLWWWFMRE